MLENMEAFLKRAGSIFAAILIAALGGVRIALDLIGWSTAPDDVGAAMSRLDQLLTWLMELPAWLVLVCIVASAMWLMWVSWPKAPEPTKSSPADTRPVPIQSTTFKLPKQSDEFDLFMDATDGEAHERLELFVIDYIQPAVWEQIKLQKAIIARICNNEKILHFVEIGLRHDYNHWQFCENAKLVMDYGSSPMPITSVRAIVDTITTLENENYWKFCQQADELSLLAGVSIAKDDELSGLWNDWRKSHNALISAYDQLKRESRYPRPLYRPQLESRWGRNIDSSPPGLIQSDAAAIDGDKALEQKGGSEFPAR